MADATPTQTSPPSPDITDEQIHAFVTVVRGAELLAKAMNCSVSKAVEMQLRVLQSMQRAQTDAKDDVLQAMRAISAKVN